MQEADSLKHVLALRWDVEEYEAHRALADEFAEPIGVQGTNCRTQISI